MNCLSNQILLNKKSELINKSRHTKKVLIKSTERKYMKTVFCTCNCNIFYFPIF